MVIDAVNDGLQPRGREAEKARPADRPTSRR
jgi:hypothetical protein